MSPESPWHHSVYDDIHHWDDEKVIETYRRLSRDLRLAGRMDEGHFSRMMEVEAEMRDRGLDPSKVASEVQGERDEFFGD